MTKEDIERVEMLDKVGEKVDQIIIELLKDMEINVIIELLNTVIITRAIRGMVKVYQSPAELKKEYITAASWLSYNADRFLMAVVKDERGEEFAAEFEKLCSPQLNAQKSP